MSTYDEYVDFTYCESVFRKFFTENVEVFL